MNAAYFSGGTTHQVLTPTTGSPAAMTVPSGTTHIYLSNSSASTDAYISTTTNTNDTQGAIVPRIGGLLVRVLPGHPSLHVKSGGSPTITATYTAWKHSN